MTAYKQWMAGFESWQKKFRGGYKGKTALASLKSLNLGEEQLGALTHKVLFVCYQAAMYSEKHDINRQRRLLYKEINNNPEVKKVKEILARYPDDTQALQALGGLSPELDAFSERLQGPLLMPTKQTQNHQPNARVNGLLFDLARTFRLATSDTRDSFLYPKRMPKPTVGKPCYKQINLFVDATLGVSVDSKSRLKDLLKHDPRSMSWRIAQKV